MFLFYGDPFVLPKLILYLVRCVPPSQVVVAVSNTYGRVRKPLGFRLVHVLPVSLEQMNSSQAAEDNECSIWIPVPPPGYIALGCVVNIGRQPPSNHVVYCLRSDLVTSTAFSDCIHTLSPTPGYGNILLLFCCAIFFFLFSFPGKCRVPSYYLIMNTENM